MTGQDLSKYDAKAEAEEDAEYEAIQRKAEEASMKIDEEFSSAELDALITKLHDIKVWRAANKRPFITNPQTKVSVVTAQGLMQHEIENLVIRCGERDKRERLTQPKGE